MVTVINEAKNAILVGILIVLLLLMGQTAGAVAEGGCQEDPLKKISFNVDQLNSQGLYGPPDGLRALDYEFCIPADPNLAAQIKAIDPTLVIYTQSKGRVRCSPEESLCLGNTHQPEFRSVLLKLASQPFIKQIKQCFHE
jgi:hypothetical protein